MNESILKALLQLFAIIANVSKDGVSFKARNINSGLVAVPKGLKNSILQKSRVT